MALANSTLSLQVARTLERQITKQVGEPAAVDSKFVAEAFDAILNRPPSVAERSESLKFLLQQEELFQNPAKLTPVATGAAGEIKPESAPHLRAREDLVHVLLNHTDFVTIR